MRDDDLRARARRALLAGDDERASLLLGLSRAGELPRGELRLYVWLYDPAAHAAWESLGEEERPPTRDEVHAEWIERRRRAGTANAAPVLPQQALDRRLAHAWARGLARLGPQAAARILVATLRVAERWLEPARRPETWSELRAAAELALEGAPQPVATFDELLTRTPRADVDELRAATTVARAVAVGLSTLLPISAFESAGEALIQVARLRGGDLTNPAFQAELREALPPPPERA